MTRTKLVDRELPHYTKNEEMFNFVSHIVGGGIGVIALILCITISVLHHNTAGIVTSIVYGFSMILLYTMSSIYHGLRPNMAKKVMQVLDHCTIYVLIAGTYTPICVCSIAQVNPTIGWGLLIFEWVVSAIAVTFTAIDLKKYQVLSMICIMLTGWAVIVFYPILLESVGMTAFLLILSGGIAYTIGAVLYGIGHSKSYMHCVFHVFVLVGSLLHLAAIVLYVL